MSNGGLPGQKNRIFAEKTQKVPKKSKKCEKKRKKAKMPTKIPQKMKKKAGEGLKNQRMR
jgi:hypothetical protein